MKNSLTPAGIEPASFRFVAQHLNHCPPFLQKFMELNVRVFKTVLCTRMNTRN